MSVSGSQQIKKRMIGDKLVKGNIGKQKFKEKHKCDKSNILTGVVSARKGGEEGGEERACSHEVRGGGSWSNVDQVQGSVVGYNARLFSGHRESV